MRIYSFMGKYARAGNFILDRIAILLAVVILLFGSYAIWDNFIAQRSAFSQDIMKYKPIKNTRSLWELHRINSDVFSWLTIPKTHIDYPVVRGKDNLEYLNKDVFKKFALSGSIFLDANNSKEMTDRYSLIYGHHMSEGAMFGDVVEFLNKKYFDKRREGKLVLLKKKYRILIFACVKTPASDGIIYNPLVQRNEDISVLLAHVRSRAIQYRDIKVTSNDRIIALSTCSEAETNGRIVLFGKLVEIADNKQ